MTLDSAAFPALWSISDATGVRPEYLLPVLWGESGLHPEVQNHAGADYWGLNQISGDTLRNQGIDPHDYLTWSASRQLRTIVGPSIANLVSSRGPIRSGTRLYQANFLPATLKNALNFSDVVCGKNGPFADAYAGNVALDIGNKGAITVGDLAKRVGDAITRSTVDAAIAQAYAVRGEPRPGVSGPLGGCNSCGLTIENLGLSGPKPGDNRDCPTCHNYAWGPGMIPVVLHGNVHHPSCQVIGWWSLAPMPLLGNETLNPSLPTLGAAAIPGAAKNPVFGDDFTAQGQFIPSGAIQPASSTTASKTNWLPWVLGAGVIGVAAWWFLDPKHGLLKKNPTSSSQVQSLLFRRDEGWTKTKALAWAKRKGYRHAKTDTTDRFIRVRQASPGQFKRLRTVHFGHGIEAVMGWKS